MKKFKVWGVALMTVIAVSVFFACGSDGNGGDSSLVGTWERMNTSSYSEILTVRSNGTGTVYHTSGSYTDTEEFKWKTSGNKLYVTEVDDDDDDYAVNYPSNYSGSKYYSGGGEETDVFIYSIDGDILTMTKEYDDSYYYSSSKRTYMYKRMK